jgi:hypothetical protein
VTAAEEAQPVSPIYDPLVCWVCKGAADPNCAKKVTLEWSGRPNGWDSLGCEVYFKHFRKIPDACVDVSIPRCGACRTAARVRNFAWGFSILTMLAGGGGFAAAFNYLTGIDWDNLPSGSIALPSLFVVAVGMLIGGIVGYFGFLFIGCLLLGATLKPPRADKHFPLVKALRARGWSWETTD